MKVVLYVYIMCANAYIKCVMSTLCVFYANVMCYVFIIWVICLYYVLYVYIICAVCYIMCVICLHYVYYMSTLCVLYVDIMCIILCVTCVLHVNIILVICLHYVCYKPTLCVLYACIMCALFDLNRSYLQAWSQLCSSPDIQSWEWPTIIRLMKNSSTCSEFLLQGSLTTKPRQLSPRMKPKVPWCSLSSYVFHLPMKHGPSTK